MTREWQELEEISRVQSRLAEWLDNFVYSEARDSEALTEGDVSRCRLLRRIFRVDDFLASLLRNFCLSIGLSNLPICIALQRHPLILMSQH